MITLRENISSSSDADKLRLTLQALYSLIDLKKKGTLKGEQAAYIVCLSMPRDRSKVEVLEGKRDAPNCSEGQEAVRGISILYGESKLLLARVVCEGKLDKWVGISSDEDISGGHVVCIDATSWEDRIGMVIRPISGGAVRRIGASGLVQKDTYYLVLMHVPDKCDELE